MVLRPLQMFESLLYSVVIPGLMFLPCVSVAASQIVTDPARAPGLLVRKLGAGEVVVAQMGRWNIAAQPDMDDVRQRAAESSLARFAENVIRWAGGSIATAGGR
jgi:hypothetical protein